MQEIRLVDKTAFCGSCCSGPSPKDHPEPGSVPGIVSGWNKWVRPIVSAWALLPSLRVRVGTEVPPVLVRSGVLMALRRKGSISTAAMGRGLAEVGCGRESTDTAW